MNSVRRWASACFFIEFIRSPRSSRTQEILQFRSMQESSLVRMTITLASPTSASKAARRAFPCRLVHRLPLGSTSQTFQHTFESPRGRTPCTLTSYGTRFTIATFICLHFGQSRYERPRNRSRHTLTLEDSSPHYAGSQSTPISRQRPASRAALDFDP